MDYRLPWISESLPPNELLFLSTKWHCISWHWRYPLDRVIGHHDIEDRDLKFRKIVSVYKLL